MPFRDERRASASAIDPLPRFRELFAALDAERGFFGDRTPVRLAAVALVGTPGAATDLAADVRARAAQLEEHYGGWTASLETPVRLVLAATLVRTGEPVADFVAAIERVRARMRLASVQPAGFQEVVAASILRRVVGGEPTGLDVQRLRAIYERMKHHHWFLTGPESLAVAAVLVGRDGTPRQIGDHVEAIYRRLADAPTIWGGGALQTAACLLGLLAVTPDEAAARFLAIATALRDHGTRVRGADYDEVAALSFLPRSAEQIAEHITTMRTRIREELAWHEDATATNLATHLALSEPAPTDPDAPAAALAEAKPLLDMQTLAAMRET